MTDKEQILFDSVSVGKCPIIARKYRGFESCKIRYIIQSLACKTQKLERREIELLNIEKERNELADKVIMWMQKCEELKEYLQANQPTGICETRTAKAILQNDKCRKTLKEIEEIVDDYNRVGKTSQYYRDDYEQIIDIISNAKRE